MARMATAVMMDTLQISRRLRDAGASEPVAEAVATTIAEPSAIVREDLATKADLDIGQASAKAEFGFVRAELAALRLELKGDIAQLETRIQAGQNRLLVWIGGMLIATIIATVTLIKALG